MTVITPVKEEKGDEHQFNLSLVLFHGNHSLVATTVHDRIFIRGVAKVYGLFDLHAL